MIVVNMQIGLGRSYPPLLHAPWNGLTPTDVVFPTFLFVVGAALSFTLGKYAALGDAAFLRKVATRAALTSCFGSPALLVSILQRPTPTGHFGFAPLSQTRILGVLQRIAIGYGVASLIVYYSVGVRVRSPSRWIALLGDLGAHACFTAITRWPGVPRSGSTSGYSVNPTCITVRGLPSTRKWILSTLPSMVNVLAGYLAARFVREHGSEPLYSRQAFYWREPSV